MSTKKILTIGEPLLRQVSHPVKKFDLRLGMILRDMGECTRPRAWAWRRLRWA